jgi:hypothetical protein
MVANPGNGSGTREGKRRPGDVKIGPASGKNRPGWGRSGADLVAELCAASRFGFSAGPRLQDGTARINKARTLGLFDSYIPHSPTSRSTRTWRSNVCQWLPQSSPRSEVQERCCMPTCCFEVFYGTWVEPLTHFHDMPYTARCRSRCIASPGCSLSLDSEKSFVWMKAGDTTEVGP